MLDHFRCIRPLPAALYMRALQYHAFQKIDLTGMSGACQLAPKSSLQQSTYQTPAAETFDQIQLVFCPTATAK